MLSYYFDEMLNRAAAVALNRRGCPVVMAGDLELDDTPGSAHLHYATANQMILVTQDRAFAHTITARDDHTGVICLPEAMQDVNQIVEILARLAANHDADDLEGRVVWLEA